MWWTKTQSGSLPWGEVVEVRWPPEEDSIICEPIRDGSDVSWADRGENYHARQGATYYIDGTEWRRLEAQGDK